jgi:hypothetical protein
MALTSEEITYLHTLANGPAWSCTVLEARMKKLGIVRANGEM